MSRRGATLRLWGWPVALAVLTMLGLLSALLGGDLFWYMLSWTALTVPLAVIIRYGAPGLAARGRSSGEASRRAPD